jgi:hypothetical protein
MDCRRYVAVLGVLVLLAAVPPGRADDAPSADKVKADVLALSKKIDAHLAKVWEKAKVTPSPKAGDYIYFRRLNLDLVGKIPGLLEIRDFIEDDVDANKRWTWVERLLEGEGHSRHFANVWRHHIIGSQTNPQFVFTVPPFEAWLKDRVEKNVGLDQMVTQLITGQGNTGQMFPGGGGMGNGNVNAFYVVNENKPESLAASASRVFLSVKVECAQCHKHPFADWTREQFWGFAAFFSGFQQQPRPIAKGQAAPPKFTPGREIRIPESDKVVKAKFLNGELPDWEKQSDSRKALAEWMTSPKNPYFARAMADHLWSYLMGVSLFEPILEPNDDSPVTHPELLADLAQGLIDHNFDAKFLIRAIVHSEAYQRASTGGSKDNKEDYALFVRMPLRGLSPEQIFDSVSEVVQYEQPKYQNDPRVVNFQQVAQGPRGEFLSKFTTQDRRAEPQTSILQALFLMNGKFMTDRTKLENNRSLQTLAAQKTPVARKLESLYLMVLSRPPTESETRRLMPYIESGGPGGSSGAALADIYWALLNSSEFLLNH